jgi:hypothetical protein
LREENISFSAPLNPPTLRWDLGRNEVNWCHRQQAYRQFLLLPLPGAFEQAPPLSCPVEPAGGGQTRSRFFQSCVAKNRGSIVIPRARERFPEAHARIISDNGPQFIAKDFKEFIRISGITHVCRSPYYPQSNEKLERWN